MRQLFGFERLCHSLSLVLLTILVAAGVYLVCALLTHAIHREDIPGRVRRWLHISVTEGSASAPKGPGPLPKIQ